MFGKRSAMVCLISKIFLAFLLILAVQISYGANPGDVAAIMELYTAWGSPPLPGWGNGDPCNGEWQGVNCMDANIESITINSANLGGELGDKLGSFSSIKTIDLSNNLIGGSIPSSLPVTLQSLFLSANQFTGSIPESLSSLTQLSAVSLNENKLTGDIPDVFQGLTDLVNLDLSSNNLSGTLPPSIGNMSALTTLHLQNNQISGTLDVLQDLRLRDLNIENNMFFGPIPQQLLSIPNFKKDGNSFNSSSTPLLPPPSMTLPSGPPFFSGSPTSAQWPPKSDKKPPEQADGPSASGESNSKMGKKSSTKRVVWISIAVALSIVMFILAILLCLPRRLRERPVIQRIPKRHEIAPLTGPRENLLGNGSLSSDIEKAPQVVRPKEEPRTKRPVTVENIRAMPKDNHEIILSRFDIDVLPPPQPPPPLLLEEKVIVQPIQRAEETVQKRSTRPLPPTSAKTYTIASLQQYTNSFSPDNLIGTGTLGAVYKGELPDGKLLAVKKLEKRVCSQQEDEFFDLVNNIDRIRHANVVELMGYCAEHGQRLLVYEYCSNGTLQDALHSDDEFKKELSWNMRIRMALGIARALEYLHEVCEPPIVHRNFKSANILLDDELSVYVSDCGLAPLISSGVASQLSGQLLATYGYGAPEFESGVYTLKSDVYSFGVVMLELLTGRMSYDRSRNRGEQFLVIWAIPKLHDIDSLTRMLDPSLNGKYPVKSLSHFADIISRCVQPEPEFRPQMSEVVQDIIEMIRRETTKKFDDELTAQSSATTLEN
ncbi:hypothetical protein DM860_008975 [Cuscuta australis]|uniref:Protein kinase domain-containing protein n=1 Tax=Cuscuta australis TaxID=267555 RepID=A0A328DD26_9ASTE|nr:hypothetical protein DM860_008975 [Cuscuta australis]